MFTCGGSRQSSPEGVLKIRVPSGRKRHRALQQREDRNGQRRLLTVKLDRTWSTESPMVMGLTQKEFASLATFEPDAKRLQKP